MIPSADRVAVERYGQIMAVVAGLVCSPTGFTVTVVSGDPDVPTVDEETPYQVPASYTNRGDELGWLYDAAADLFGRLQADLLVIRQDERQRGCNVGRHETEGVVQLAAHQKGTPSRTMRKEQVRVAFGVPKGSGAYDTLLARSDAAARSNAELRNLFLYASAGLRGCAGK